MSERAVLFWPQARTDIVKYSREFGRCILFVVRDGNIYGITLTRYITFKKKTYGFLTISQKKKMNNKKVRRLNF